LRGQGQNEFGIGAFRTVGYEALVSPVQILSAGFELCVEKQPLGGGNKKLALQNKQTNNQTNKQTYNRQTNKTNKQTNKQEIEDNKLTNSTLTQQNSISIYSLFI